MANRTYEPQPVTTSPRSAGPVGPPQTNSSLEDQPDLTDKAAWITVQELADVLGVSPKVISIWKTSGRMPQPVRLPNGRLLWHRTSVSAWLRGLQETA